MKIGCCLNMVATKPDGTGMEHLKAMKECGYDYVEMPMAQMMALSDEEFASLADELKELDLPCETSNNLFPVSLRLTGPEVDQDAILAYAEKAFARAKQLGIEYCVFGSGPAKNVPEGFPMEEGYAQVVALLRAIAPIAQKNDVTIVIEPLRRAECNLINSFAEGVQLAKDADVPGVKVLVDFYHLTVEQEPVSNLEKDGAEYLRHVHFANPTGRVYPVSADEADYLPFVNALKTAGYDARVSCEAYAPNGFEADAPAALKMLRELFA